MKSECEPCSDLDARVRVLALDICCTIRYDTMIEEFNVRGLES